MKKITLFLIMSLSYAAIEFSGDARFRPRLDTKEYTMSDNTADFYYLYRARINMKADIGEGWFFNTKLGTNGVAGMTKISSNDSGPGNLNSFRPSVDFSELYFGYMKDDCGLWVGAFPLKYTPAYDLHFYSDQLVDIPWVLFNNSSTTGFAGYQMFNIYKVNWFLSVDQNYTNNVESALDGSEVELKDSYTLGINSSIKISNFSISPNILIAMGDGKLPMTYGFDVKLPNILNVNPSISYHSSTNDVYDATHMRLQLLHELDSGKVKFFYDMAGKDSDDLSYIWLSYTHTCYKGDLGSVTISPTYRAQNGGYVSDVYDTDYSRSKFEITTEIKFK